MSIAVHIKEIKRLDDGCIEVKLSPITKSDIWDLSLLEEIDGLSLGWAVLTTKPMKSANGEPT